MNGSERDLLERAAARLDRLLADVTTGRWQVDRPWSHDRGGQTSLVTAGADRASVVLGVPPLGTGRTGERTWPTSPPWGRRLAGRWCAGCRPPRASPANPVRVRGLAVAGAILAAEGQPL